MSLAEGKSPEPQWDQKTGPISHMRPHPVPSSNGIVSEESGVPEGVCEQRDPSRGGRGQSQHQWLGPSSPEMWPGS